MAIYLPHLAMEATRPLAFCQLTDDALISRWTDEGYVLVEPHRTTTLTIADESSAALTDDAVVEWKIEQGAPGAVETYK